VPERPRPDIDHTREALRRHDERPTDDPPEEPPASDEGVDEDPAGGDEPDG
jgi:hypothetical protein